MRFSGGNLLLTNFEPWSCFDIPSSLRNHQVQNEDDSSSHPDLCAMKKMID